MFLLTFSLVLVRFFCKRLDFDFLLKSAILNTALTESGERRRDDVPVRSQWCHMYVTRGRYDILKQDGCVHVHDVHKKKNNPLHTSFVSI